jgi:protein-tyrosine-phosphatase
MTKIIVVGGADTGRAPMTAALLRRHLLEHGNNWSIESAGVLGHDGDTWQPETKIALENLSIVAPEHTARSLTAEMVSAADLLLTVDRGTGRALELRYATSNFKTLPDLAGTAREVPDPFRMTLDAWIVYGRELDAQLKAALPLIVQLARRDAPGAKSPAGAPAAPQPSGGAHHPAEDRLRVLVRGIAGLPELIDWQRARAAIGETLQTLASSAVAAGNPADLRPAAVAMLLGMLGGSADPLSAQQLAILSEAVELLAAPIDGVALGTLAGAVGRWTTGAV